MPDHRLPPSLDAESLIRMGHEAKQLLETPLFRGAVLEVERNIITAWRNGKTPVEREGAFMRLQGLGAVMVELKMVLERGRTEVLLREDEERRNTPTASPGSRTPTS